MLSSRKCRTATFLVLLTAFAAGKANSAKVEDVGVRCDNYASADDADGRKFVPLNQINVGEAIPVCLWAHKTYPNEPRFLLQLGRAHERNGQYTQAVGLYEEAAAMGSAAAMYQLGMIYTEGLPGYARDEGRALQHFLRAADNGYPKAQVTVGRMYAVGKGAPQDLEKAVIWFRKAANQSDPNGLVRLGLMYDQGQGVAKNDQLAFELFQKAADKGLPEAAYLLAVAYQKGKGVEADQPKAMLWLRKSADQGHDEAQYALGSAYIRGDGVATDFSQALDWFQRAAKQGHGGAYYGLGNIYSGGFGVERHPTKAAYYFKRAADKGILDAKEKLKSLPQVDWSVRAVETINDLRDLYSSYLTVNSCYELRKNYMMRFIDESEIAAAKTLMRKLEDASLLTHAEREAAWKDAGRKNQEFNDLLEIARVFNPSVYSADINTSCRAALLVLQNAGKTASTTRARDF